MKASCVPSGEYSHEMSRALRQASRIAPIGRPDRVDAGPRGVGVVPPLARHTARGAPRPRTPGSSSGWDPAKRRKPLPSTSTVPPTITPRSFAATTASREPSGDRFLPSNSLPGRNGHSPEPSAPTMKSRVRPDGMMRPNRMGPCAEAPGEPGAEAGAEAVHPASEPGGRRRCRPPAR